jgi:hypothetical protein
MVRLKGYLHSGLLNMVWKTYGDPSSTGLTPASS